MVVALGEPPADPVAARQANEICLKSLWQGKTLLAADVPRNRDASPEGRGCLWFEAGNPRDLGYRMAFLGRKPEFRAALGAAGRMYIFETRNTTAVGRKYDEAYRYAASRRKSSGVGPTMVHWSRRKTGDSSFRSPIVAFPIPAFFGSLGISGNLFLISVISVYLSRRA